MEILRYSPRLKKIYSKIISNQLYWRKGKTIELEGFIAIDPYRIADIQSHALSTYIGYDDNSYHHAMTLPGMQITGMDRYVYDEYQRGMEIVGVR